MESIRVRIVEFGDRKHFQMQFVDPSTGRKKTKSSGVERDGTKRARIAAEREAAKLESELREGRYHEPLKVTWETFRERYESQVLPGKARATDEKVSGVFNLLEQYANPARLCDLNAAKLSHWQTKLRDRGLADSTINAYSAHLRAALNWAKRQGLLAAVPTIERLKRAKGGKLMKGRPITLEEFERMLAKVPAIVGEKAAESWRHYLEGLWASGLRLGESLVLTWDPDDTLCVDYSGKRPMLRIPAELEKGHQDRLLPMAPEFAEFLERTPRDQRTGFVFNPLPYRGQSRTPRDTVCRTVSRIGEAAGVKVNTDPRSGKVKYASAHDLRRSFGERWSTRVMPQVLMELMRHESIETTLKFYVGRNAQATADVLWAAHKLAGNTFGNSDHFSDSANRRK